ncbi:MAG: glycosyltransferase family 4 protein [Defluviitaleaceae bacterium]|nr:glycosyltransferase family 4 protein [Defluviitaleaceae bacterium]
MKILHIISDTNIGGAGRHLLTLFEACNWENFKLELALPVGSALVPLLKDVNYHELPYINEKSMSAKGVIEIIKLIRDIQPDIVHTHASFAGRIAGRLGGCHVVYTRHSVFEPSARSTKFPLKQLIGLANNFFSDGIIAVSPAAKDILLKTGVRESKIKIIYNGVAATKIYPLEERAKILQKYDIPHDNPFIVSQIARLEDVKGHNYTLDAAKIWAIRDPTIFVLIAGTGPMQESLAKRIKDERIKNVQLLGFVEDVDKLLNITNVQINSSYGTEATSLSLLEGMSLGVPAVVSDFGGNPFVITHKKTGLIFPQKDARMLADMVILLKNDNSLMQSLVHNSQIEYKERFRDDIMARNIENVYKDVIGRRFIL